MTFVPRAMIPGLDKDAARVLVDALRAIAADLNELRAPFSVTQLITANRNCSVGELVRCCPPAAGMTLALPEGNAKNQGGTVRVDVESVASGGSVTISAMRGQPINGVPKIVVSTVGLQEFVSLGPTGWGVLAAGGLTAPVSLSQLQTLTGPTLLGLVSGTAVPAQLTPAQYTSILSVFTAALAGVVPASGGGTTNFLRADGNWTAPPAASPGLDYNAGRRLLTYRAGF